MKRVLAIAALAASACASASAATTPSKAPAHAPAPAKPKIKVAPADEYFGKMKMSILGIRNQIKDLGLKADYDPEHSAAIMSMAGLTEDALHDFEKKYPSDPWIPRLVFLLERTYAKVYTDDGRVHAKMTMQWVVSRYPNSYFGKLGKKELAENHVGAPNELPKAAAAAPAPAASPAAPTTAVAPSPAAAPATTGTDVTKPVLAPGSIPTGAPVATPAPASTGAIRSVNVPAPATDASSSPAASLPQPAAPQPGNAQPPR